MQIQVINDQDRDIASAEIRQLNTVMGCATASPPWRVRITAA